MIKIRTYALAFIPAAIAAVVVLFSISAAPRGLEPLRAPGDFETAPALELAAQVVELGDDRTPGSEADLAAADLVKDAFTDLGSGMVAVQEFEGEFDGRKVPMKNVILTLPGRDADTVVLVAGRDWPSGPGRQTSAAATGLLVGIADELVNYEHSKTFVLASTDGLSAGAAGARQLISFLDELPGEKSVIVLSQPGTSSPHGPFVVESSTGRRQGSTGLAATITGLVPDALAAKPDAEPKYTLGGSLARLAVPLGLGEQAPLIAAGVDAAAVSSAGEKPASGAGDEIDEETFTAIGDAVLLSLLALDATTEPVEHGPEIYLRSGDTLVNGAPVGLLTATLLLPALVALGGAAGRTVRSGAGAARLVGAVLAWAVPFFAGLAVFYLGVITNLVPSPAFPFFPSVEKPGTGVYVTVAGAIIVVAGAMLWLKPWRAGSGVLAAGTLLVAGGILVTIGNPYLGLLLCLLPHLWIPWVVRQPAADTGRRPLPRFLAVIAAAVCVLPLAFAVRHVATTIGADPWDLLFTVSGGQFGPLLAIATTLLLSGVAALGFALDDKPIRKRSRLPITVVSDANPGDTAAAVEPGGEHRLTRSGDRDDPAHAARSRGYRVDGGDGEDDSGRPRSWSNP